MHVAARSQRNSKQQQPPLATDSQPLPSVSSEPVWLQPDANSPGIAPTAASAGSSSKGSSGESPAAGILRTSAGDWRLQGRKDCRLQAEVASDQGSPELCGSCASSPITTASKPQATCERL
jgi:hypothetical protein